MFPRALLEYCSYGLNFGLEILPREVSEISRRCDASIFQAFLILVLELDVVGNQPHMCVLWSPTNKVQKIFCHTEYYI